MTSDATWLPNLVGGTSIWKLAVDLNEPKFFDGRLLVPETEGSESLPVTVRWDLTGLVPLAEARAKHPDDVAAALADFQSALGRVAKVFATPNSGFDRYKEAFTVPSLEADGGANYFYSPAQKKVFAINWGASPRSMGGKAEYVFGYEDWSKRWGDSGVAAAAPMAAAAAAVVAAVPAEKKDEPKEEQKKPTKKRPWWLWPLFGLAFIAIVLLALLLLKTCDDHKVTAGPDAGDAVAETSTTTEAGIDAASVSADADASADASADAASADAGDAGADAARADAGGDGGREAGADDDDDDDFPEGPGGGAGGGGAGGGGGTVVVKVGPGGGTKTAVHRKHYSDGAVKWRVAGGANKVSRTEQRGERFDVWLSPGQTFEGVRVEWQDKAGKWHVH